jgi:hypothetical protein
MRIKMKGPAAEVTRLTRILDDLDQELVDASDEDVMQAAADLGMNPKMKGSAAYLGVCYPTKELMKEFFELVAMHRRAKLEAEPVADQDSSTDGKEPSVKGVDLRFPGK